MQRRTTRALAAAAALALSASACTDTLTAPPAARAPSTSASLSTSSSGPTLVSTAVRYRDTGGKPARGRSGNAVVDAMALLDREGVTTLEFSARHATDWWRYGTVNKAQLKASSPDGKHKFTRNLVESDPWYGPRGPVPGVIELRGLGRGDELQLQANVTEVDPPRTDVVTVTQQVRRLPELTVEMTAPAEAETNTYVNVLALVREHNGDLGTEAVCDLYVGGELVDWGWGVWVDAGDAVTCIMTFSLQTPGTYPLEVRVRTASGREWDTGNNADSATIQVHGDSPRFYTSAWFEQLTSVDSFAMHEWWRDAQWGTSGEYEFELASTATSQWASLYGYMPARITGPLGLRISMSTGGRVVDAGEWTHDLGDDPVWGCADRWDGRAMFWLCTGGGPVSGFTQFSYSWLAGAVTYHSREYSRIWDELSGTEYVYHWNYDYAYGETVPLGDDWTFDVRLTTTGGEHVVTRPLPLVRSEPLGWSSPYTCYSWEYDWGWSGTHCSGGTSYQQWTTGYQTD
jgi:hypothetical protein